MVDLKQIYENVSNIFFQIDESKNNNGSTTTYFSGSRFPTRMSNKIDIFNEIRIPKLQAKGDLIEVIDIDTSIIAPDKIFLSSLGFNDEENAITDTIPKANVLNKSETPVSVFNDCFCQAQFSVDYDVGDLFESLAKNKHLQIPFASKRLLSCLVYGNGVSSLQAEHDVALTLQNCNKNQFEFAIEYVKSDENGWLYENSIEDNIYDTIRQSFTTTETYGVQKLEIPDYIRNLRFSDVEIFQKMSQIPAVVGPKKQFIENIVDVSDEMNDFTKKFLDIATSSTHMVDFDVGFVPTVLDIVSMYDNAQMPDVPTNLLIAANKIDDNRALRESCSNLDENYLGRFELSNLSFTPNRVPFVGLHAFNNQSSIDLADRLILAKHAGGVVPLPDYKPNMMQIVINQRNVGTLLSKFQMDNPKNHFIDNDIFTSDGIWAVFNVDGPTKDKVVTAYLITLDQFLDKIARAKTKTHLEGIDIVTSNRLSMAVIRVMCQNLFNVARRSGFYAGMDSDIAFNDDEASRRWLR